jgi:hypothetical protein
MSKPLGFYTGYNPQTQQPDVLHKLQERFGDKLQQMTWEQKVVMRAALANFIANKPVHQPSPHPEEVTLMQGCIEGAGADWNIWDNDPELCEFIEACELLHESDLEGLITAISAQIAGSIYLSRLEEWEVVRP